MRTNTWMSKLLQQYEIGEDYSQELIPELRALLDAGFHVRDGAYLFARLENTVGEPPEQFEDLTGYECAVNHFHPDFYLDPPDHENTELVLKNGVAFVHALARKLRGSFPGVPFRIILDYSDETNDWLMSCTIRFHKVRPAEEWIKLDDLDGYKTGAILIVSIPGDEAGQASD